MPLTTYSWRTPVSACFWQQICGEVLSGRIAALTVASQEGVKYGPVYNCSLHYARLKNSAANVLSLSILLSADSLLPGHDGPDLRNRNGCLRVPAACAGAGGGNGHGRDALRGNGQKRTRSLRYAAIRHTAGARASGYDASAEPNYCYLCYTGTLAGCPACAGRRPG